MFLREKSTLENLYFIDNHTHGAFGINFNFASYSETKFLLKELYKKNIRGICPTLVGDKAQNIQKQLALFKKIKNEQMSEIQDESLILGVHLEGTFLSPQKPGIQDKTFFKTPSVKNFKELVQDYTDIIKIVTLAPEEDIDLIDYLNEINIKTQAGHTLGENLKNCRAATHQFNAMPQIHHRNPSITLEALNRDDVYCEIIADLVHCSFDILKLFLKVKPKDKVLFISDSLPCANYNNDIIFCNKKINPSGKDDNGTIAGSNKTLDEICKNLISQKLLNREDIENFAFLNQIKYFNLKTSEIDILNR